MPIPLRQGIVYGPVRSRRLGRSLGINLLPRGMKVCNMDCAYCQYGGTRDRSARSWIAEWPAADRVEATVSARLRKADSKGELIDRLTVAGHGAPTLHPAFEAIAERLCRLRDRVAPALRLAILSNSTTAGSNSVRRGLPSLADRARHSPCYGVDATSSGKEHAMPGPAAAYAVALFAMLLAATAAVTVIFTVRHLDSPEVSPPAQEDHTRAAA